MLNFRFTLCYSIIQLVKFSSHHILIFSSAFDMCRICQKGLKHLLCHQAVNTKLSVKLCDRIFFEVLTLFVKCLNII